MARLNLAANKNEHKDGNKMIDITNAINILANRMGKEGNEKSALSDGAEIIQCKNF